MSTVHSKLCKLYIPKFNVAYIHGTVEIWLTTEDTNALEKEMTRPWDRGSDAHRIRERGIRRLRRLLGYYVRWDMPKTEAVIIG